MVTDEFRPSRLSLDPALRKTRNNTPTSARPRNEIRTGHVFPICTTPTKCVGKESRGSLTVLNPNHL
jgi:hypothetical protein